MRLRLRILGVCLLLYALTDLVSAGLRIAGGLAVIGVHVVSVDTIDDLAKKGEEKASAAQGRYAALGVRLTGWLARRTLAFIREFGVITLLSGVVLLAASALAFRSAVGLAAGHALTSLPLVPTLSFSFVGEILAILGPNLWPLTFVSLALLAWLLVESHRADDAPPLPELVSPPA